ncbi:radical SAM protein [Calditerrivibrio nitroreducens]|uniref:Radical SAM domain protein n=1 Tax=Calditerrivibrio nitroreducens (strain DSM 19672 / NBRC 101217 / Yu37-1) TaxID=768670 RepID=E4TIS7_CALNY|nr:radical SAM protein [Calditerrivibrio nitroreducens]ADR18032.1 radical SAM domain protein [Calditerrivibrio nitroreducens DSM 19672]
MYNVTDLIKKSLEGERLNAEEIVYLLSFSPDSPEGYEIIKAGALLSRKLSNNVAEVHGQFALNLAPCPADCKFCSFASINKVFTESKELSITEAINYALDFEKNSECSSIYIMTTANYDFGKFIEYSTEIKKHLKPETILIANIGDQPLNNAIRMKEAGFTGVYHAVRMGEGRDNKLTKNIRLKSIENFKSAGLLVGTCVEPIGLEHTMEEIAEKILIAADINPVFSGAMRRINIPGSELSKFPMVSELKMAQIVAVTRLATPHNVIGNCTHEPNPLGIFAGANLIWAESGANPRDIKEKTEESRGFSVARCADMLEDMGWNVLKGGSAYFSK